MLRCEATQFSICYVLLLCDNAIKRNAILIGDETDSAVTKAYESFLLLTLRQPNNPEYKAFAAEVKLRARRDYGYEFAVDESV